MPETQQSPYVGLDKALLRSTRKETPPATQETDKPGNRETGKPARQEPGKLVDTQPREKKTYMLRSDALEGIDDIKRFLKRQHVKTTNERIVEEALLCLFEDFQKNQETSLLVRRFTSKTGRK